MKTRKLLLSTCALILVLGLAACGKSNTPDHVTPSQMFNTEERTLWFETNPDDNGRISKDRSIDSMYVFENGTVDVYDFNYSMGEDRIEVGEIAKMSDDEIIALAESQPMSNHVTISTDEVQKHRQEFDDFNEANAGLSDDDYFPKFEETFGYRYWGMGNDPTDDGEKFRAGVPGSVTDCRFEINVVTDETGNNAAEEEVHIFLDGQTKTGLKYSGDEKFTLYAPTTTADEVYESKYVGWSIDDDGDTRLITRLEGEEAPIFAFDEVGAEGTVTDK